MEEVPKALRMSRAGPLLLVSIVFRSSEWFVN